MSVYLTETVLRGERFTHRVWFTVVGKAWWNSSQELGCVVGSVHTMINQEAEKQHPRYDLQKHPHTRAHFLQLCGTS